MRSQFNKLLVSRRPAFAVLNELFRVALYRRITRTALPLFVRGGDIISAGPMAVGSHEPQVAATLKHFAAEGFNKFLLDIGANIGLTTSAAGSYFDRVVLFEPNPLCLGILETNVAISLTSTAYEIRRYGLGRENSRLTLRVPRSNWGGAYIVSDDNAYSSQTLLAKDGFKKDDPQNYLSLEIDICNASDNLGRLFAELKEDGKSYGSVKIDVEGFETVVLQAIAETLPPDMGLSIIFEHWGDEFKSEKILSAFYGRAHLYALVRTPSVAGSRWRKLLSLLTFGVEKYSLQPWEPGLLATDLVLRVDSIGSNL